jgi:DNA polymerase-3 subunit beta
MQVQANRQELLAACQIAGAAAPTKDAKPVLRNLKLTARGMMATIAATDLEIGALVYVPVHVGTEGEALLPAVRLVSILRECEAKDISLELGRNDCTVVRGESASWELPADRLDLFPDVVMTTTGERHQVTIDAATLKGMLKRVTFAVASIEHPRFGATTGLLWDCDGGTLTLAATDGRRLAIAKAVCAGSLAGKPVVPMKAIGLLERSLGEGKVVVTSSSNDVAFEVGTVTIYSRLVEGRFPNYRQVIPQNPAHKVEIPCGQLYRAVRQAAIMASEESVGVVCEFSHGKLTLQSNSAGAGRSKVEVPIEFSGGNVRISFSPKFLTDMLKVHDGEAVVSIMFTDEKLPTAFLVDESYLYVIATLAGAGS